MKQLLCRDLRPGDILLKMATSSLTHKIIQAGQKLGGQPNSFLGHAAIALDTQFCIEAQAAGISGNHLAMNNKDCGYIVYRPKNAALGQGAATAAKLLLDIHQKRGSMKYGALAAAKSIFGKPGRAKSAGDMEALLEKVLAGKGQSFFCSQFVVYVYQWAAEQSGLSAQSVFGLSDAKASPSMRRTKSPDPASTVAGSRCRRRGGGGT